MLLINTNTITIHEFIGNQIPPYAILSHTWERGEVSLWDMRHVGGAEHSKAGYQKISQCCSQARRDRFEWVWIDTCCIDKTSSAELSEVINSMYKWYKQTQICYVYLADTTSSLYDDSFAQSRWFTRGWTLQELIAPMDVEFYDRNWTHLGAKSEFAGELSRITGIDEHCLLGIDPRQFSVSERMSWAAGRETTREEDRAYSLLGLFDINMSLLYGEGPKAFQRLQKKIMKSSADRTILAWTEKPLDPGLLAASPDDFAGSKGFSSNEFDDQALYDWPPTLMEDLVTICFPVIDYKTDKSRGTTFCFDIACRTKRDVPLCLGLSKGVPPDDRQYRSLRASPPDIRWKTDIEATTAMSVRPQPMRRLRQDSASFLFLRIVNRSQFAPEGAPKVDLMFFENKNKDEEWAPEPFLRSSYYGHLAHEYSMYREALSAHREGLQLRFQGRSPRVELQHVAIEESFNLMPKCDFWDTGDIHAITLFGLNVQIASQPLCRVAVGVAYQPLRIPWCIVESIDTSWTDDEWFEDVTFNRSGEHTRDSKKFRIQDYKVGYDCHISVGVAEQKSMQQGDQPSYNMRISLEYEASNCDSLQQTMVRVPDSRRLADLGKR